MGKQGVLEETEVLGDEDIKKSRKEEEVKKEMDPNLIFCAPINIIM